MWAIEFFFPRKKTLEEIIGEQKEVLDGYTTTTKKELIVIWNEIFDLKQQLKTTTDEDTQDSLLSQIVDIQLRADMYQTQLTRFTTLKDELSLIKVRLQSMLIVG